MKTKIEPKSYKKEEKRHKHVIDKENKRHEHKHDVEQEEAFEKGKKSVHKKKKCPK